jgi:uncharacterized protein (DUF1800 family)
MPPEQMLHCEAICKDYRPLEMQLSHALNARACLSPFVTSQPNGWPDRAADWATPEAMTRRIDWA